jgi:hypothetical protein
MEGHETCKTQLSHYPHHLIRAGMCQKIILSILSFAHALQTPNGWTGNTFGFSSASIPSETDPLRGEFYASSTFVHFLPKGYSRAGAQRGRKTPQGAGSYANVARTPPQAPSAGAGPGASGGDPQRTPATAGFNIQRPSRQNEQHSSTPSSTTNYTFATSSNRSKKTSSLAKAMMCRSS